MINGFVIGDAEVVRRIRAVPASVRGRVQEAIGRLVLRLQSKVMRKKLTRQVLKVRTGTLRRSIDQRVVVEGNAIAGVVSTNVKYAKFHEFGFTGTQQVKAHLRMMKTAWGRPVAQPREIAVRAHSRAMDYPARSFLRTSLRELTPDVRIEIDRAVTDGIKQSMGFR